MFAFLGIITFPGRVWKIWLLITISIFFLSYFYDNLQKVRHCVEEIKYPRWQKNLIELFTKPVFLYDPDRECLICFDTFEDSKTNPRTIKCSCTDTLYHEHCLTTWFEKSCSCPVCRKALNEKIHYL